MNIIASSPQGLEDQLAQEIINLGGENIKIRRRFVTFQCNYETLFKLHFYSRIAFRFYREVARFSCTNSEALYKGVQSSFDWLNWIPPNKAFCVQVSGGSKLLNHSHFSALQVKNAIVDMQKSILGQRSNISLNDPSIIIHLYLNNQEAVVSLQTTHESLHKRGYRPSIGYAPLKENLAAGLIQLTKWDGDKPFIDIMCGSGTFLIEAASQCLKMKIPLKDNYLFENWIDFDKELFEKVKLSTYDNKKNNTNLSKIIGCEINTDVFEQAKENINLAGLSKLIEIHNMDFAKLDIHTNKGIILCNPPYGKKLGKDQKELSDLYSKIGHFLKEKFSGWEFWLLSGNAELTRYLRMKASMKIPVSNGGIDCRWIKYEIR